MPTITTPKTEQEVIDFCDNINNALGEDADRVVVYCEVISYATGQIPATFLTEYNEQNNTDKKKSLHKGQLAEIAAFKNGTTFTEEFNKIN